MKIGIITTIDYQHASGFIRYETELIRSLLTYGTEHQFFLFTRGSKGIRSQSDIKKFLNARIVDVPWPRFLWREAAARISPQCDVYLYVGPQMPFWLPANSVVVLLDFSNTLFPPPTLKGKLLQFQFDLLSKIAARSGCRFVSISEATKKDCIRLYRVSPDRIRVIYPGITDIQSLSESALLNIPKSFFLFVGTIKGRKNVFGMVQAYRLFKEKTNSPVELVIVGRHDPKSPYWNDMQSYIKEHQVPGVHFVGSVPDEGLKYLYRHAFALLFPSKFEGFGFPVVEAMQFGLPVITSTTTSLGEIARDAALLVDPEREDDIASAMERLVRDDRERARLIEAGYERAKKFTWENTAKGIIEECTRVMKKK